jgi:hypothetical protein
MEIGEASLEKSWSDYLLFGWGFSYLAFRRENQKKKQKLMKWRDFCRAYRCPDCGASLIATAD